MTALKSHALRRLAHRTGVAALVIALGCSAAQGAELQVAVRDTSGKPLSDMVIYAEMLDGAPAPIAASAAHAIIDQINKKFVPRVTVIQTGTAVDFPNNDNIRHEVYSFSTAKIFTSKLYSGRPAAPVVFDKPGPVVLGCNIHDHMIAWVRVVDTPYFTKSDADGKGTLAGLKPGEYRLNVWYPAVGSDPHVQEIHVGAERGAHADVELQPPPERLPAAAAPAQ